MTILLTNLGLAIFVAWTWIQFGSFRSGLGYLRGDRLIPDAYLKSFGIVEQGSAPILKFTLTNMSNSPIKILGGNSTCTCMMPLDLPITIPRFKSIPLIIKILTHNKHGSLSETVRLYTDFPDSCDITLEITGSVRDSVTTAPKR